MIDRKLLRQRGVNSLTGGGRLSNQREWIAEEEQLLSEVYPKGLTVAMQAFPYRTKDSIHGKAKKMGLSCSQQLHWTGREEAVLRRLWVSATTEEISKQLSRHRWNAIRRRAQRMGLSARAIFVRQQRARHSSDPIVEEIYQRMQQRGFTLVDLDEAADIGRNVSGAWFNDRSRPQLRQIRKAIEALGGKLVIVWEDDYSC
jgi:hypothetical protein